jgi:hypothetical protein
MMILSSIIADKRLLVFSQSLTILVILACFSGCGGDNAQQILPTSTPFDVDKAPLTFLVPLETKPLFLGVTRLAENSGIPYEIEILEVTMEDVGAQAVIDGHGDLMFLTRRPWPDELLSFYEIFRTPTTIFINTEVGLDDLTSEQATAIFTGEVTNWSQIGGPSLEIHLFVPQTDDSSTEAIRQYLVGNGTFAASAQIIVNDKQLISLVGGLPGAIGFTVWASKQFYEELTEGSYPTIATLDGLAPDHIDYPLIGSMGLIYRPDRHEDLQLLLDWVGEWLESEFGQALIGQYGYSFFYSSPNDSGIDDNAN